MTIEELNADDCFNVLQQARTGVLACSHHDRPYAVPIQIAYDERKIYAFSLEGKKIEIMRANPQVCLLVQEKKGPRDWYTVVACGRFEEFRDEDGFAGEMHHAWSLLQRNSEWWEPGAIKPEGYGNDRPYKHVFFGIWIEEISGRHGKEIE